MRRFPWRYAIYLLLAAYVLVDVYVCGGPLRHWLIAEIGPRGRSFQLAAQFQDEKIRLSELEEGLRDYLWRHGQRWDALSAREQMEIRRAVASHLVDDRFVRAARLKDAFPRTPMEETDEMVMFVKQFDRAGDFEARLDLRGLSRAELNGRMRQAIEDQMWIESKIDVRIAKVTEQDVTDWFREHGASMAIPPTFGVAHIYLTTHDAKKPDREAEIGEIHRKLIANEATFDQLALQYSEDERSKKIGGGLGWCARGRTPEDFMNIVEKLEEGAMSEPAETKLGWHVVRLIDRKPGRVPTVGEVEHEIMALLHDQRRENAVAALISDLRAQAADSMILHQNVIDTACPP